MMQAEAVSPSQGGGGDHLALLPDEILFQVRAAFLAACCAEVNEADPLEYLDCAVCSQIWMYLTDPQPMTEVCKRFHGGYSSLGLGRSGCI